MGFSKQEYWSGLPFPFPGVLPYPGFRLVSPALAGGFFTTRATWKSRLSIWLLKWTAREVQLDGLWGHFLGWKVVLWINCLAGFELSWEDCLPFFMDRLGCALSGPSALPNLYSCCSVTKSCPTLCDPMDCSTRLPCPSPSPGVFSNSCPLSQWYHPTISSSVTSFSSCPQYFPASGSFPKSQLFTSGSQSIGASTSASVLPMNIQGWFPLGLTGLISLKFKGLSRIFSSTTVWKHQFLGTQPSLWSNSHIHAWPLEKP